MKVVDFRPAVRSGVRIPAQLTNTLQPCPMSQMARRCLAQGFFSRFLGNAGKWSFRFLEFLADFGLEFWKILEFPEFFWIFRLKFEFLT